MMWKRIFLLLFVFSFLCPLIGHSRECEDSTVLLELADHLYAFQQYDASITEFWRFLFFHPNHPYTFYAYYKAALAYRSLDQHDMAISLFRRALRLNTTQDVQQRIRYQLALAYLGNGNYEIAELEFFKLSELKVNHPVSKAATVLSALLLVHQKKWVKAQDFIQRSMKYFNDRPELLDYLDRIQVIMEQPIQSPRKKSPALAKWLSTFLPGSGQVYSGHILDGINALGLNIVTTYFLCQTIQDKNIRDASLVFWFVWLRYYKGNRLHAEEAAILANQSYLETILEQIYRLFDEASSFMSTESLTIEFQDVLSPDTNYSN